MEALASAAKVCVVAASRRVHGGMHGAGVTVRSRPCLARRLLRLLALSLGLPPQHFHAFFQRPMVALRPLHYAALRSDPGAGVFGAGAHSDYGTLWGGWPYGDAGGERRTAYSMQRDHATTFH